MLTISLSDRMAQKLWKKLSFKENEVWIYLRNKIFNSTGFPRVMEAITGRSLTDPERKKSQVVAFGIKSFRARWRHSWRVLTTGIFVLNIDTVDEALNLAEAKMRGGKSEQTRKT